MNVLQKWNERLLYERLLCTSEVERAEGKGKQNSEKKKSFKFAVIKKEEISLWEVKECCAEVN